MKYGGIFYAFFISTAAYYNNFLLCGILSNEVFNVKDMTGKNILIIGGGLRLRKAADAFAAKGHDVTVFDGSCPLKSAVDKSDMIVLGIPVTNDDSYLNAEGLPSPISIKDLAMMAGRRKLVAGGRLSEHVKALFDVQSVRWADYALSEEFETANAVPTAEGAIAIAMDEFPFTIHSSSVTVSGYGRVGKALARRLKALGANVTVCARSAAARSEAESEAMKAIDFSSLAGEAGQCDILFNTVPAKVIGADVLSALGSGAGVIDLASKPGGVDLDSARSLGVNVIWALGLPGKVAPATAGQIIANTVLATAAEMRL